jgi:hypothetical protein
MGFLLILALKRQRLPLDDVRPRNQGLHSHFFLRLVWSIQVGFQFLLFCPQPAL